MTPLHYACYNGNKEVVPVLLANNASLEAKDKVSFFISFEMNTITNAITMILFVLIFHLLFQDKGTPLHVACKKGHNDIAALIEAHLETKKKEFESQVKLFLFLFAFLLIKKMRNLTTLFQVMGASKEKEPTEKLISQQKNQSRSLPTPTGNKFSPSQSPSGVRMVEFFYFYFSFFFFY